MGTKNKEIIREYTEDVSILTGKRKKLFENMRKLYPKGNEKSQIGLCLELDDSRVDYYIKFIFNTER